MKNFTLLILLFIFSCGFCQEVTVFQQFNGRYDYLSFGNTLNLEENTGGSGLCEILTESSADYDLQPGHELVAAYLYWAGSGLGDFDVTFAGNAISAEREFSNILSGNLIFFAAYANVTSILQANGNGNYLLSDLDLTAVIPDYCGNTTNFGGWAVTVIYRDESLPLNQVSIFDGLESVSSTNRELTINLDNLLVLDTSGAKIGFLAWEGDSSLAVNETLRINGNILSNLPLNPSDNAFNSTNSFTGSSELYNMDIDFYNIQNFIQPGDTSAVIQLTSGQDFVMINNIITVLNTELPDATIEIDSVNDGDICGNRDLNLDYTVYNVNSTAVLPANTPIAFYADDTVIGQSETQNEIEIDGSESGTIQLSIPENIPQDFTLKAVVDDTGNGQGIVNEINETNNEFELPFHLKIFPDLGEITNLETCDAVGDEIFNLNDAITIVNAEDIISFHLSEADAQTSDNPIPNPENFINTENPQTIFIRLANDDCFVTGSFTVKVILCALPDATISITNDLNACRQRDLQILYTVSNLLGTAPLPANTPIAFYLNDILIAQAATQNSIPVGGNVPGNITLTLDENVPDTFTLRLSVDDQGNGIGVVEELDETNNDFVTQETFGSIPPIDMLPDLLLCDEGFDTATFNLTVQNYLISTENGDLIIYYITLEDALANENAISDPSEYHNISDPQTIYVRLENETCFATASFLISTENCKPFIPQGFSPNGDNINDEFEISNLLNIYENFQLLIYSREGNLIYEGGNVEGFWNGIPNVGLLFNGNLSPTGTYFYVLQLNDLQYPDPFLGFVYINY